MPIMPALRKASHPKPRNPSITVLINNDVASEEVLLEALSPNRRSWTRERAASHPCATPSVIMKALSDPDSTVVEAALANNTINEDLLSKIIQPLMDDIAYWVPDDESSFDLMARLDRNHKIYLARAALSHPNVSPQIIAEAMFHHAEEIRESAAKHPNLNNPVFVLSVKAKICG